MSEQIDREPIVQRDSVYERVFFGHAWLARCPQCKQIISRYDFDEEGALACGREALQREHRCRGAGGQRGTP